MLLLLLLPSALPAACLFVCYHSRARLPQTLQSSAPARGPYIAEQTLERPRNAQRKRKGETENNEHEKTGMYGFTRVALGSAPSFAAVPVSRLGQMSHARYSHLLMCAENAKFRERMQSDARWQRSVNTLNIFILSLLFALDRVKRKFDGQFVICQPLLTRHSIRTMMKFNFGFGLTRIKSIDFGRRLMNINDQV